MKINESSFIGADAIRLARCIMFAAAEGLQIDSSTQAGINQGNGNVWLWSEDWPACVYLPLGAESAPCLFWTCPNCGHEKDCKHVSDAYALAEYFNDNDACTHCENRE